MVGQWLRSATAQAPGQDWEKVPFRRSPPHETPHAVDGNDRKTPSWQVGLHGAFVRASKLDVGNLESSFGRVRTCLGLPNFTSKLHPFGDVFS